MRFNHRSLAIVGLILASLLVSVSIPAVSFAQNSTPPPAPKSTQPRVTTDYPSWRDFDLGANNIDNVIAVQGKYLWIGTFAGVLKWDTTTNQVVATYTPQNSGLVAANIGLIVVDKTGNVWLVSNIHYSPSGVSKFDGTNWQTFNTSNSGLPSNTIYSMTVDSNGNVWFGTDQGIAKFNGSSWQNFGPATFNLQSSFTSSLTADTNGNVWAGIVGFGFCNINNPTVNSALFKYDGNNWISYSPPTINSVPQAFGSGIVVDKTGNVWVSLTEGNSCIGYMGFTGIAKFDGSNWQIYPPSIFGNVNVNVYIGNTITVDAQGNIWVSAYDKLGEFDGSNWQTFQNIYSNDPNPYGVVWGSETIAIDTNGNKWLGGFHYLGKFNQTDGMLLPDKFAFDFNAVPDNSIPTKTLALSAYNTAITYSTSVCIISKFRGLTPLSNPV